MISSKQKHIIKLNYIWLPEKIEKWLEDKELQGLRLNKIGINVIKFYFTREKSRHMQYYVEYRDYTNSENANIYNVLGWELVGQSVGKWFIWRIPYVKEKSVMCTNKESVIERNKRIISNFLLGMFAPYPLVWFFDPTMFTLPLILKLIGIVLCGIYEGLILYFIINIALYNKKLKSKI